MISPTGSAWPLENADSQLPPGNELFDHHLIIELTRVPDCCFQIFGPFHHSQSYGRPLFRRFYNDRPPEFLGHVSRRNRSHQPGSGRDARVAEQPFGDVLIHGQRTAQRAAAGVRHPNGVEQGLNRPVFPSPSVQREEQHVGLLDLPQSTES